MCLWWMRGFHEVRWSNLWPLWLFATRLSKKDTRYSSDSVGGTSAAGTSESPSPEKWKDEDLGWFPNPKSEYTEFSNSILPKFCLSLWATCPCKERFRHFFVTERKRQREVREALKAINHSTPRGNIKYGRKRTRVKRNNYVSWEKIVLWHINFSTPVN